MSTWKAPVSWETIVGYVARRLQESRETGERTAKNFERNLGLDSRKILKAAEESLATEERP